MNHQQALQHALDCPTECLQTDARQSLIAVREALPDSDFRLEALRELAFDLLEIHEATGISLDAWASAREFVEAYYGPIVENGA